MKKIQTLAALCGILTGTSLAFQQSSWANTQAGSIASSDAQQGAPEGDSAEERYGLTWVKRDDGTKYVIRTHIVIDAPIEKVWTLVRDPNHYQDWNRAITARAQKMEPGAPIELAIRLYESLAPVTSDETIGVIDDARKAISWNRDVGENEPTARWQILESDGNLTHYYSGLKTPGFVGLIVEQFLSERLQRAFNQFAEALSKESKRKSSSWEGDFSKRLAPSN